MYSKFHFIALVIIVFTFISCNSNELNDSTTGNQLELKGLAESLTKNVVPVDLETRDSITSMRKNYIPIRREDLNKMRTVYKMYYGKDNAGLTVPGFGGLKLGKDESSLHVYYIETKVVNNESDSVVYGCGYSIHYLFRKVARGINVDNIPSVAASVQLNSNKTQVFYSLQTYGMKGINLVQYFKPMVNKTFDVEGFGNMQSSIDGIHNILADPVLSESVKFEPEILKFIKPYELEL
jgi:hypothetical protein